MMYSPAHLQLLNRQGVNTTDFNGGGSPGFARGVQSDVRKWTQTDADGYIVIAYSVTAGFPYEADIDHHMAQFGKDLMPCMRTEKVDRADLGSTQWAHGILFGWEMPTQSGCWSWVGLLPGAGFVWNNPAPLTQNGAPATWQMIHLSASCGGNTEHTVHHEALHALGIGHEHNRPD